MSAPLFVIRMHDGERILGKLESVEAIEEGCQIARIDRMPIVLPSKVDLSSYIGKDVGIACFGEQYHIRELT